MSEPTTTSPRPLFVVGDVMADVVVALSGSLRRGGDTPSSVALRPGGSAANLAAWAAVLGLDVTYGARVGADALGSAARAALAADGVRCHVAVDDEAPTGTCVVLVEPGGERTMLPDSGANTRLSVADLPPVPAGAHLHLSGYVLLNEGSRAAGVEALSRARAAGATTSVDPSSAGWLEEVGVVRFLAWTAGVDLLLANAEEAAVLSGAGLSGRGDPEQSAAVLARTYPQVVVKLGAQGALWTSGERSARATAEPVDVVDTTGAGDAFGAGFLSAWLAGRSPADALSLGCATAARVVTRLGARP